MFLAESHCHLDLFTPERQKDMFRQIKENQVGLILNVGMNLESSAECVRLAQSHPEVLAAVGVHPWEPVEPTDEFRRRLAELASQDRVVAIGEIGLDYGHDSDREVQKDLLRYEFSLAREMNLPVNVHCSQAHNDMMEILRNEFNREINGMVHDWGKDPATIKDWLDLGFYITLGMGNFLHNEHPSLLSLVREIPQELLLIETDAAGDEYGVEIKDLVPVVEKLAGIRGVSVEKMAEITAENLKTALEL